MREALCPYTRKIQILIYENDLEAKKSLLLKPITKTSRASLCVYSKYSELIAHRHKESEYFKQFSPQFLETCKNLLRFERRLTSFRALREAFHIERKGPIFVKDLLSSLHKEDIIKYVREKEDENNYQNWGFWFNGCAKNYS